MVQKQAQKSALDALHEEVIPVPEAGHRFFQEGFTPEIKITITAKTFKKAEEIANILMAMRRVDNPTRIGPTHPHVVLVNTMEGNERPIAEIVEEVRRFHEAQADEVQSDAGKLALAQMTKLNMNLVPEPYEPQEMEVEFENDWEKPRGQIPVQPRNLNDIYEKRLKLYNDMLNACGIFFANTVTTKMNEAMAVLFGKMKAGPTDEANFRS